MVNNRNDSLEKVMNQFMNNYPLHEKLMAAARDGYHRYCATPYIMPEKKLIDNDFLCLLMEVLSE